MAAHFALPVRLSLAEGESDIEIYTAEEAIDVLLGWSVQAGRLYQRALDDCFAATVEAGDSEKAYRAFLAFAKASNILARDVILVPPRGVEPDHLKAS